MVYVEQMVQMQISHFLNCYPILCCCLVIYKCTYFFVFCMLCRILFFYKWSKYECTINVHVFILSLYLYMKYLSGNVNQTLTTAKTKATSIRNFGPVTSICLRNTISLSQLNMYIHARNVSSLSLPNGHNSHRFIFCSVYIIYFPIYLTLGLWSVV
jgi:hypothetical protein